MQKGIRRAHVHILVEPSIIPEQFRVAANRLYCTELHLFTSITNLVSEWKNECKVMGIYFHPHDFSSNQIDMLEDVYNVGEIVANRNVFLCLNTEQPLISNMITQFITHELKYIHENSEDNTAILASGCCYQISKPTKVLLTPIYPYWDKECQMVIETLTTTGERMSKKEILNHIEFAYPEHFSKDILNRALKKLERWLVGFQGFVKEREGKKGLVYEFQVLVEL